MLLRCRFFRLLALAGSYCRVQWYPLLSSAFWYGGAPDKWTTTKQACRDTLIVYLFFVFFLFLLLLLLFFLLAQDILRFTSMD